MHDASFCSPRVFFLRKESFPQVFHFGVGGSADIQCDSLGSMLDTSLEAAFGAARLAGVSKAEVERRMHADRVSLFAQEKRDACLQGLTAAFLTVASSSAAQTHARRSVPRIASPGSPPLAAHSPPTSTPAPRPSSGDGAYARIICGEGGSASSGEPRRRRRAPPFYVDREAAKRALSALPPGVQMAALLGATRLRTSPTNGAPATGTDRRSSSWQQQQRQPRATSPQQRHDLEPMPGEAFAQRKEPMSRPPRLPRRA